MLTAQGKGNANGLDSLIRCCVSLTTLSVCSLSVCEYRQTNGIASVPTLIPNSTPNGNPNTRIHLPVCFCSGALPVVKSADGLALIKFSSKVQKLRSKITLAVRVGGEGYG